MASTMKGNIGSVYANRKTAWHYVIVFNSYELVEFMTEFGAKFDFNNVVDYLTKMKKRKAESEPGEIINSKDPCIMCFEPRNGWYVLMPCGHTSLCESCCIKITCKDDNSKCPTCRKPINSYNQIFFQKPE